MGLTTPFVFRPIVERLLIQHIARGNNGEVLVDLLLTLAVTAMPWLYLAWVKRLAGMLDPIPESDITRLESLPKHVRIELNHGEIRTFGVDLYDLDDLRQQLELGVIPRQVKAALAKIQQGESLTLAHPVEPVVFIWVCLTVLAGSISVWLTPIPLYLLVRELLEGFSHERIWSVDGTGLTLGNGETLPWEQLEGMMQGPRTVLLFGTRAVILNDLLHQRGWLLARVVREFAGLPVLMVEADSKIWNARLNQHALFVAGTTASEEVVWLDKDGEFVARPGVEKNLKV